MIQRVLMVVVAYGAFCDLPLTADDQLNVPPPGFVALFNGKDLTGWHGMGHFDPRKLAAMNPTERAEKRAHDLDAMLKHWHVENGEIVNDGEGPYLTTDQQFGDIELLIDYKTVAKADSGIYLRATPQVQIWDTTPEGGKESLGALKGSGGLWNNGQGKPGKDPLVHADRPFGEWNRFRIIQIGDRTTVYLNGLLVVDNAVMENTWDRSQPLFPTGPIQLQTHGGEIRWRNIFVREIAPQEARAFLGNNGFVSVFNGRNLDGWEGAVESYEVVDGAIQCKKGKGGTLYTTEIYGDFIVRLEFRLPHHGNNGLAIRFPGIVPNAPNGSVNDPAYGGMCELQVLDNSSYADEGLDPRQFHGSVYGKVAAHRGYLRPVGEWNFQQVTVIGSRIKVELNGTTIVDADLSQVEDFMGGDRSKYIGHDLKEGHFGFAGHGDPVQFRNISIMRL